MTYTASSSMEFTSGSAASRVSPDEAQVSLTHNWGAVVLGDDDGADDVMVVGGYSLLTAAFGYDGGLTSQVARGGVGFTGFFASLTGDTGDATKISYFTPRWNGLQLVLALHLIPVRSLMTISLVTPMVTATSRTVLVSPSNVDRRC